MAFSFLWGEKNWNLLDGLQSPWVQDSPIPSMTGVKQVMLSKVIIIYGLVK